jgi:hypothetical protein
VRLLPDILLKFHPFLLVGVLGVEKIISAEFPAGSRTVWS